MMCIGKPAATVWFGNDPGIGPEWTSQAICDAYYGWPDWTLDTPDWYRYTLEFDGNKWAVSNHPGSSLESPHSTPANGVPMWGSMLWSSNGSGGYAEEPISEYILVEERLKFLTVQHLKAVEPTALTWVGAGGVKSFRFSIPVLKWR